MGEVKQRQHDALAARYALARICAVPSCIIVDGRRLHQRTGTACVLTSEPLTHRGGTRCGDGSLPVVRRSLLLRLRSPRELVSLLVHWIDSALGRRIRSVSMSMSMLLYPAADAERRTFPMFKKERRNEGSELEGTYDRHGLQSDTFRWHRVEQTYTYTYIHSCLVYRLSFRDLAWAGLYWTRLNIT